MIVSSNHLFDPPEVTGYLASRVPRIVVVSIKHGNRMTPSPNDVRALWKHAAERFDCYALWASPWKQKRLKTLPVQVKSPYRIG